MHYEKIIEKVSKLVEGLDCCERRSAGQHCVGDNRSEGSKSHSPSTGEATTISRETFIPSAWEIDIDFEKCT